MADFRRWPEIPYLCGLVLSTLKRVLGAVGLLDAFLFAEREMPQKFGLCGHCLKALNSSRPTLVRAVVQTRQADCELGIFPDMTIYFDCAVMLLGDNVVADR
jgi:hypothetical protein